MPKKEKEPTYKLFDKEYTQAELNEFSNEQKMMIQHRDDLMNKINSCLLYTSPSPRDRTRSRMPSSA